ncbi:MAG: winged helix-turn-helix transcriptional regulator [Flavobacteriales bacterium]|nr:winged helix-turn-helix transcriptional regulator [Flavobacteriales bacterium]
MYSITEQGKSLEPLIGKIVAWGQSNRKMILG